MNNKRAEIQPVDWPHDTHLMQHDNCRGVTEEITVHSDLIFIFCYRHYNWLRSTINDYNTLQSFASQFAQGIRCVMKSLGTEDGPTFCTKYFAEF